MDQGVFEMNNFSSYKFVQSFKKAGIKENQAEAIIEAISASRDVEGFASVERKIERLEEKIDKVSDLITRWFSGLVLAILTGVVGMVVKGVLMRG